MPPPKDVESVLLSPLVDFYIGTDSVKFTVHKQLLTDLSPAFKAALNNPAMREAQDKRMVIQDVDSSVFAAACGFAWSGSYSTPAPHATNPTYKGDHPVDELATTDETPAKPNIQFRLGPSVRPRDVSLDEMMSGATFSRSRPSEGSVPAHSNWFGRLPAGNAPRAPSGIFAPEPDDTLLFGDAPLPTNFKFKQASSRKSTIPKGPWPRRQPLQSAYRDLWTREHQLMNDFAAMRYSAPQRRGWFATMACTLPFQAHLYHFADKWLIKDLQAMCLHQTREALKRLDRKSRADLFHFFELVEFAYKHIPKRGILQDDDGMRYLVGLYAAAHHRELQTESVFMDMMESIPQLESDIDLHLYIPPRN